MAQLQPWAPGLGRQGPPSLWSCYSHSGGAATAITLELLQPMRWRCYSHHSGAATAITLELLQPSLWSCYSHSGGAATAITLETSTPPAADMMGNSLAKALGKGGDTPSPSASSTLHPQHPSWRIFRGLGFGALQCSGIYLVLCSPHDMAGHGLGAGCDHQMFAPFRAALRWSG